MRFEQSNGQDTEGYIKTYFFLVVPASNLDQCGFRGSPTVCVPLDSPVGHSGSILTKYYVVPNRV